MAYQATCNNIGCGWKGTIFDHGNAIDEAYTEADAHRKATVEEYATGVMTPHKVIVAVIDNDSPELELRPSVKESVG